MNQQDNVEPSPSQTPEAAVEPSGAVSMPTSVKIDKTFPLPAIGFCLAAGPSSSPLVYVGTSDFSVYAVDPTAEKVEARVLSENRHSSYVTGLVRHGDTLVSAGYDCAIIWWNAQTGEVLRRIENAHDKWIRRLAVSPDGTRIASVADDMRTKLWDFSSGECLAVWGDYALKTPHHFPSMLYAVTFSPDGTWLATGDRTGKVLVRESATGRIVATIESPGMYTWDPKARRHSIGGVRSLAFSSDSALLAVGGIGHVDNIDHLDGVSRIEIFRWQSGERQCLIEDNKYKGLVEAMRFAPGNQWLAAAGGNNDGFISVFSTVDGKMLAQEKAPMHVHDFEMHSPSAQAETEFSLIAVGYQQGVVVGIRNS